MALSRAALLTAVLGVTGCGSPAAAVDAGSDPTNFCFSRPKLQFCEDFEVDALPGAFDSRGEEGGAWSVDEAGSTTAPKAAKAVTSAANARVVLRESVAATGLYKLFLQLRVDAKPATGEAEVLGLDLGAGRTLGLELDAANAVWLKVNGARLGQSTRADGWISVRFDVSHRAADGGGDETVISLKLGEEALLTKAVLPFAAGPETPVVTVGVTGGAGWTVRYDTVTFITQ